MLFRETNTSSLPTIILLHGGGLSDWSLKRIVNLLKNEYHVLTPVIEGHGDNANEPFISIEQSASNLIRYIDDNCNGKVFALCGLSLGAQIVVEALSQRTDITQNAIIESALVLPIWGIQSIATFTYNLMYGLIKYRWFAKLQAKAMSLPKKYFEQYYADSIKISKQSLINITVSNGSYQLKDCINETKAQVLLIVGDKEIRIMKKSARILNEKIPGSKLHTLPYMKHGELSLCHFSEYVNIFRSFVREVE